MEGIIFYLGSWSAWVYYTFIHHKGDILRFPMSVILLTCVILSITELPLGLLTFNGAALFLMVCVFGFLVNSRWRAILYFIICSLIIGISYASLNLFSVFDPVIFFVKKEWIQALLNVYLTFLLQKEAKWRFLVYVAGTMNGEILYSYMMSDYAAIVAGSLTYLDFIVFSGLIYLGVTLIKKGIAILSSFTNPIERGKKLPHE